ncbi:MAG TPA: NYN domain-containing protein [bacterium]|nr:NYN domain-containing protein [bacterium]
MQIVEQERRLAVFIDFENLALGFKQGGGRFDITRVLARLVEKGKIIVKRAYADWVRYSDYKQKLHEAAIELIEIPKRDITGKNSADIRLVVDAIDLAYAKAHIDTFVIVSGDSDFSPLMSKLKENGKYVIGLGMRGSTSELLRDNCDEFIYYEDLKTVVKDQGAGSGKLPEGKKEVFGLLLDSVTALMRENKPVIYASMVKDTMKRKDPSFDEGNYGYRMFNGLLEDAENQGLIMLYRDGRSGTYVVSGLGEDTGPAAAPRPRRKPGARRR